MEFYSMLCGSLDGREVQGRTDPCICMAESLRCSPETITTLLADYESESEAAQSCPTLCDPTDCSPPGSSVRGIFQPIVLDTDCHFLLQGIFPTQGLNPGFPHCRQTLYRLSHQGSPLIDYTPIQNKKFFQKKKPLSFT